MILLSVKRELFDSWKSNESAKLLVCNESIWCALVSWIDEILPCKGFRLGITDRLVIVSSCVVFRNSEIFAP